MAVTFGDENNPNPAPMIMSAAIISGTFSVSVMNISSTNPTQVTSIPIVGSMRISMDVTILPAQRVKMTWTTDWTIIISPASVGESAPISCRYLLMKNVTPYDAA